MTQHPLLPGPEPEEFLWATGIEDTFVPQTRPGHRALDEYQLMGHYEHWREDLALAATSACRRMRWGVPWYRVEPLPGEFDWSWTDQVIPYMVEELGITPILDLMHYGCPFWLRREFASDDYPRAVAAYAAAFARRYRAAGALVHAAQRADRQRPDVRPDAGSGRPTCAATPAISRSCCSWCAASCAPSRRSRRSIPAR